AFCVDLTTEDSPDMGYIAIASEVCSETDKPFAMLSNFAAGIDRNDAKRLEAAGIPVLEGTPTGLAAFRHLFEYRDYRALPSLGQTSPVPDEVRDRWRARLSRAEPLDELEGLRLLTDYGVPATPAEAAEGVDEAVAAAARLGYPVALKTAKRGIAHKSDVGGVRLGLGSSAELVEAYRDMAPRLGRRVTVAKMAPPGGVEVALGIARDPQFGPLVLVAAGGILVELLRDRRLALPPLDPARAMRLIDRLKVRPLLDGFRGAPPADVGALARAVVGLSWLAHDLGDLIDALDANPVVCYPEGCAAVDALVIRRGC